MFTVDVRAEHHEFLATQATEHIRAAQAMADALAHGLQHPVAHGMTVLVVDPFEMVDVEHDHRQFTATALDPGHFGGQALLEIATVVDTGQRISDRQRPKFLLHALQI